MERLVVTARLRPQAEAEAKRLVAAGPPFDPAELGLHRHDVYLGEGIVVFVFEAPDVELHIADIVNDPVLSASFSAWGPLIEERPHVVHEAYHWERRRTP